MQAHEPNTVRERRVALLLMLCSLLAFATPASALPVLDQQSNFVTGFTQFNELPRAQVFTVGLPGQLEAVEVFISQLSPTGNLIVSIYDVVAGQPPLPVPFATPPLATASIPVAGLPSSSAGGTGPAFVWINLDVPLPVLPGDRLVLVLQKDSGGLGATSGIAWFGNPGSYLDGEAWRYDPGGPILCATGPPCEPGIAPPSWQLLLGGGSPTDFAFRSYVPESSTGIALVTGFAALMALHRRSARHAKPARARPVFRPSETRSSRP